MMDKKTMLTIFGALPEDKLMEALSVIGIEPQDENQSLMDSLGMDEDTITPWNERTIETSGNNGDKPPLVDKAWLKPKMNAMPAGKSSPNDMMGEGNIFLQTGGGA